MAYWILNKKNNTPAISGSIKTLSEFTGIKLNFLYEVFSRGKLNEFENEKWRIFKTQIIKSLRNGR